MNVPAEAPHEIHVANPRQAAIIAGTLAGRMDCAWGANKDHSVWWVVAPTRWYRWHTQRYLTIRVTKHPEIDLHAEPALVQLAGMLQDRLVALALAGGTLRGPIGAHRIADERERQLIAHLLS